MAINWNEFVAPIFIFIIIPLSIMITTYIIKFIIAKAEYIKVNTDNEMIDKYIDIATNIITEAVKATNQTYVNTLKAEGKFDLEAQQKAFEQTKTAVLSQLNTDVQEVLSTIIADLNVWITNQIENAVLENKN